MSQNNTWEHQICHSFWKKCVVAERELDEGGLGGTELLLSYCRPLARAFRTELQKLEILHLFMYLNLLQRGTSEPTIC